MLKKNIFAIYVLQEYFSSIYSQNLNVRSNFYELELIREKYTEIFIFSDKKTWSILSHLFSAWTPMISYFKAFLWSHDQTIKLFQKSTFLDQLR